MVKYYFFKSLVAKDGSEVDNEKMAEFDGRYYAKFRTVMDYVYWNVITPLMEMKHGHPIKTLDVECCRLKGLLETSEGTITITTNHHVYTFEETKLNPLDELLKE